MAKKYHQGKFRPTNPGKYKGDISRIEYRSSWELQLMLEFDRNESVIQWSSEEIIINYMSPIDMKNHRYFPDFYVKHLSKDKSKVLETIIEVKPFKETRPPAVKEGKKKPSVRYLNEVKTWGVNSAKWAAAEVYCKKRGYHFVIMTEHDIKNFKGNK